MKGYGTSKDGYYGKVSEGGCPVSVTETPIEPIYRVGGVSMCLIADDGFKRVF